MKHLKPLLLIASALSLAACSDAEIAERDTQAAFSLTIAHINDTHSSFDPVASSFTANEMRVYNEFGGHPRILEQANYYRAQAEAENQSMLFLHGGDAWQGSAYFKLNEGRMNADILSRMQLDAMALGNHEFDLTNAHLNAFLSAVNFPMLAANVDASVDEDLKEQNNLLPYVVFAFDGFQKQRLTPGEPLPEAQHLVAVFGLALDDMPNIAPNTGDLVFANMVETAQSMVDEFHAMGIDKVVALTHIGKAIDVEIANQVNGIDVIVGGHSHTLLGDFSDLGMGYAGTYAEWVINPDGESATCVVQAGEYAQAIGRVEIDFTNDGRVLDCVGGNTLLSNDRFYRDSERTEDSYLGSEASAEVLDFVAVNPRIAVVEEEASMRAHIDSVYRPAMESAYGAELGMVPAQITHVRTPTETYPTGSEVAPLVALGQFQWAATEAVANVAGLQVDFALVGAGGVRQSLAQGLLREGDITLELLPFANFISIVPLTGAQITQLLQDTVAATVPSGAHAGKFPYGGNMRYRFDETQPGVTGEIVSVEINRGSLLEPEWHAVKADATYNVAMNSYNATGNDGWDVLYEAQKESSDRVDLAYVDGELTAFAVDRIERTSDGRLQVIYETDALQCDIAGVACNTDAMAVVEFLRDIYVPLRGAVLPLPYGVVEWNLEE
ncbi:bifunctional metallophosphatase/5'-nucleotidase [Aliidiomarina shirensis]|uniref:Bifunctional metallophosphatase/5'-nucleotidase n=1 Tax=Aliidiomarina shirensis TaxID=1048642 RepID=A0A432WSS4_9GAMM|nr:bifunctional metallophosphatase/5'-nucleotidase [Aliidiomarina shirensis]RUO36825.1 bifunctional metallophosphatase/5'-nucleotidase [Aliidiomarina shirensis]